MTTAVDVRRTGPRPVGLATPEESWRSVFVPVVASAVRAQMGQPGAMDGLQERLARLVLLERRSVHPAFDGLPWASAPLRALGERHVELERLSDRAAGHPGGPEGPAEAFRALQDLLHRHQRAMSGLFEAADVELAPVDRLDLAASLDRARRSAEATAAVA